MISPLLWFDQIALYFQHTHVRSRLAPTSVLRFFYGFRDLVDGLLAYLLNLADRLVGLALRAKVVVARQRTSSFLDSALCHICLSTHDGAFCCYEVTEKTERKKSRRAQTPQGIQARRLTRQRASRATGLPFK